MLSFQLCEERDNPFESTNHKAEIKQDGRRVAIIKKDGLVSFWGRDHIVPGRYPELVEAFKTIEKDFVFDSEFVVFVDGKSDRGLLQTRDKTKDNFKIRLLSRSSPASAVVFDVLEYNNNDLRNESYQTRRTILESIFNNIDLERVSIAKQYSIDEAWKIAQEKQLEGIVIKKLYGKYDGKRTDAWIKVKRKEILPMTFTSYDVSTAGITLISDSGDRVACHGQQHHKVKAIIDEKGSVQCEIRRMAGETSNGRSREIVFWKLVE